MRVDHALTRTALVRSIAASLLLAGCIVGPKQDDPTGGATLASDAATADVGGSSGDASIGATDTGTIVAFDAAASDGPSGVPSAACTDAASDADALVDGDAIGCVSSDAAMEGSIDDATDASEVGHD